MVSEQLIKYSEIIPMYLEKISVEVDENSDL
jgi:hypothetical protein